MLSPIHSHKEARRYAIAWLLSAAFIFIAEYSYEIRLNIDGWHIRVYDPFFLYSVHLFGHSLAAYAYAINLFPFVSISWLLAIKIFAPYKFRVVNLAASLIFDWAATCMFYGFRDPSNFDETETNIIFLSIALFCLQIVIYKYRRFFAPVLIRLQIFAFRLRR